MAAALINRSTLSVRFPRPFFAQIMASEVKKSSGQTNTSLFGGVFYPNIQDLGKFYFLSKLLA